MKKVSENYRNEMREPFKNKWLCKVVIGAVNNTLQTYGYIECSEKLSDISEELNYMLQTNTTVDAIATFEKNDTRADGSTLFYDTSLNSGVVFDKILQKDDSITFTYRIDDSYTYRDVERFIINFSKTYPKKITITYDIKDSPFYKTETFDNDSFTFEVDELWEDITYITVEMSDFSRLNTRLVISDILFGDILVFDNTSLSESNSITFRQYMSFTSEELPYKELNINVVNENQKYDIEDETNDVRLLEKGQDVYVQFGYEYLDGSVEWLEDDKLILNDYEVNETYLNIMCSDMLNNMSDSVEVDSAQFVYDLSVDTLSEGYEDVIKFDSRLGGFTPQGLHVIYEGGRKEGILMLANAYGEVIKIDSDNKINAVLNNFYMEQVTGDFAPISNIDSIKDFYSTDLMYFRDYATFEQNYTKADGTKLFPVESNNEFTGFIGSQISGGDNMFPEPIELTLTYHDNLPYAISLIFVEGQAPRTYKYEVFNYQNTSIYASDVIEHDGSDVIALNLPVEGKFKTNRIKFTFIDMFKSFNTIHIKAVKDMYISDYIMDSTQYENYYPSCENMREIKSLNLISYAYEDTGVRSLVYQGTPIFDENGTAIVLLNNPCLGADIGFNEDGDKVLTQNGVTITQLPNKVKHIQLTDNGYDGSTLKIYGTIANSVTKSANYAFAKTGESIEITNNLLPARMDENDSMSRWFYKECQYTKLYKVNFMGDPALENGDIISIQRKQGDNVTIRIEKLETTFSSGGIRGYLEGRKI